MEATKVTITPQTRSMADLPMSPKHRRRLREARFIELIRSKPAGTRIQQHEIVAETGVKRGGVTALISSMVKQKKIQRYELETGGFSYSVTGDARVIAPPPDRLRKSHRQHLNRLFLAPRKNQLRILQCALAGRTPSSIMICAPL